MISRAFAENPRKAAATTMKAANASSETAGKPEFNAAEMGALAHLYRGEVFRSTSWRTRLDTTTNWAVVVTGLALSISFSSSESTPLPLILVGLLVAVFLFLEARRYRYFNVWRARARLMEKEFYVPILKGGEQERELDWRTLLARDYLEPRFHIDYSLALGRRLRKNYWWVFSIQLLAYLGKITIHPGPLENWSKIFERAAVGPVPGQIVLAAGLVFHLGWLGFLMLTWLQEKRRRTDQRTLIAIA